MAIEAILELDCSRYSESIFDILNIFNKIGWKHTKINNKTEYLQFGDDDDYDWQEKSLLKDELEELIKLKQKNSERIGINLYYEDFKHGISFLAYNTKTIVLSLNINRKRIIEEDIYSTTDVGWYIEHIIHKLRENNCIVESFKFEEYVD